MINSVVQFSDNKIEVNQQPTVYVGEKFRPGFFTCFSQQGHLIIEEQFLNESHIPYNTKSNKLIIETVQAFFKEGVREDINKMGFIHKLGILTYGRQGTGKTSLLNFIAKGLVEKREAIVFICNTVDTLGGAIRLARMIRQIQETPIVFIADEFERYAQSGEAVMKIFLDGSDSIDNMLFLAATNYIDKVPATLKDRPSRFKVVEEITGMTSKPLIRAVLRDISAKLAPKELFTKEEIEEIVASNKDVTMDELKHICLDKATNNYLPKSSRKRSIGFKLEAPITEEDDEEEEEFGSTSYGLFFPTIKQKLQ